MNLEALRFVSTWFCRLGTIVCGDYRHCGTKSSSETKTVSEVLGSMDCEIFDAETGPSSTPAAQTCSLPLNIGVDKLCAMGSAQGLVIKLETWER